MLFLGWPETINVLVKGNPVVVAGRFLDLYLLFLGFCLLPISFCGVFSSALACHWAWKMEGSLTTMCRFCQWVGGERRRRNTIRFFFLWNEVEEWFHRTMWNGQQGTQKNMDTKTVQKLSDFDMDHHSASTVLPDSKKMKKLSTTPAAILLDASKHEFLPVRCHSFRRTSDSNVRSLFGQARLGLLGGLVRLKSGLGFLGRSRGLIVFG